VLALKPVPARARFAVSTGVVARDNHLVCLCADLLRSLPRTWKLSSAITALVALTFGAYNNMADTVGRPIFDIIGPMARH
jgi:hypothetical protein